MMAITAAGRVRAAPMIRGQSWPICEKMVPAMIGPKIRAIELEAMFRPSMAPWRSGSTDREIRAERLGMVIAMPEAPTAMMAGTSQSASGHRRLTKTCAIRLDPNVRQPTASTRASNMWWRKKVCRG